MVTDIVSSTAKLESNLFLRVVFLFGSESRCRLVRMARWYWSDPKCPVRYYRIMEQAFR